MFAQSVGSRPSLRFQRRYQEAITSSGWVRALRGIAGEHSFSVPLNLPSDAMKESELVSVSIVNTTKTR